MGPQDRRSDPGRRIALFLAIGVHVLLALFLFFGVNWKAEHPTPMVAELWSEIPKVQPQPQPAKPKPKPEPEPEPEPPKPEPKPEPPKSEPKPEPKPDPDIALEKEKERKRLEEQKRQEELKREKERKEKEEAERKKEEERKKAEAERKRKAEAERKKKEEAERKKREEQRRRELAEAERKRILSQLGEAVPDAPPTPSSGPLTGQPTPGDPTARAGYVDKIRAKIRSNIVLPPDIPGNPEAQFDVTQLPTGEVVSVTLRKSSGVTSYDNAVERAIWKSSPLPPPERRELFERQLNLRFRPVE